MLAFTIKSISYICSQSGKITAGIDGIPWGIHTTGRHMHSAKKSAVSTPQSLNIFGGFTQNCCMAYSKHGSECIPEGKQSGQLADLVLSLALRLHLKQKAGISVAGIPAFAEKVQCIQQMELAEIVIYSEQDQDSLSRRQCCKTHISGEISLEVF